MHMNFCWTMPWASCGIYKRKSARQTGCLTAATIKEHFWLSDISSKPSSFLNPTSPFEFFTINLTLHWGSQSTSFLDRGAADFLQIEPFKAVPNFNWWSRSVKWTGNTAVVVRLNDSASGPYSIKQASSQYLAVIERTELWINSVSKWQMLTCRSCNNLF